MTATTPPADNATPRDAVSGMLENTKHNLLELPTYLGSPDIVTRLIWLTDGRDDRLVLKDDADDFHAKLAEHNAKESSNDDDDESEPPSPPASAQVSLVGTISQDGTWVAADGGFQRPTKYTQCFELVEQKLTVVPPDHHVLRDTHNDSISNLKTIMENVADSQLEQKGLLQPPLYSSAAGTQKLVFRNRVFEPLPDDGDNVTSPVEGENAELFTIRHWPVKTNAAKDAIPRMFDTHTVNPLFVYDRRGRLISPAKYEQSLRGALVQIIFTLTHYHIRERKDGDVVLVKEGNTFSARIVCMHILVPPAPTSAGSSSPIKRKVPSMATSSPTKKNKTYNA